MGFLTDFADQAVVLPLLATITVTLGWLGWWRGSFAWLAAGGGTLIIVLILKLAFIACGGLLPEMDIHSPSGHTAAAAVVTGGFVTLGGKRAGVRAGIAMLVAVGGAAVFGMSRLALGLHTLPEVVLGGFIGIFGALLLTWLAGPIPERLRTRRLIWTLLTVALLFHGFHLRAEAKILHAAAIIRIWPFSLCRA